MSHLKNALRLVGICLEFESPVMVYEYVEGIALSDLLYREGNHEDQTRKTLLSWEIDYRLPMRSFLQSFFVIPNLLHPSSIET